jgi:hypothetical protein
MRAGCAGGFFHSSGSHESSQVQSNYYSRPGDGHITATPSYIGRVAGDGIIHGTNALRPSLKEQEFPSGDPKRFESDACIVEWVLFEWFCVTS